MEQSVEIRSIATACEQQWLYQIEEQGIVYFQAQNRFAGLDAAGLLAYQAFDAGASPEDLHSLVPASPDSPLTAEALNTIFALSKGQFPEAQQVEERREWPPLVSPPTANVKVHGIPISVEFPDGKAAVLGRDCFQSTPRTDQPARFHLSVHRSATTWTIKANGEEIFPSVRDEQIGLGLLHAVRSLLYADADYDVAFHAAMVADDQQGVLLCAPREAGKSTLSAYLAAHCYALVSDEPAFLRIDNTSIFPVEMPISLKEGTWSILYDEWPQLAEAPIHVRSDGRRIKLLHPGQGRFAITPQRLTHIVFPRYSAGSPPSLKELSAIEVLTLLNDGGMLLGKKMRKDTFESLLRMICATPAFIMNYTSLAEADDMMHEALEQL